MHRKLSYPLIALAVPLLFACSVTPAVEPAPPVLDAHTQERMALIRRAQSFEQELGWAETENFRRYSPTFATYQFCVYTEEFSFTLMNPKEGESCASISDKVDKYTYDAEALATIRTPALPSLVQSPLPRFLNVVFHEDFHEQMRGMPTRALDESATTLMGLASARDFARREYGLRAPVVFALQNDIEFQVQSAKFLVWHYDKLDELYTHVRAGRIDPAVGRKEKSRLFAQMQEWCADVVMTTINSCKNVTNNAQLAFLLPYAEHYGMFYTLFVLCSKDTRRTGDIIMRHADARVDEAEYIRRIKRHITYGCTD